MPEAAHVADAPEPLPPIAFVRDADQARSLLDPLRRSILQRLLEPGSASSAAEELDLPRQRVNYHVRTMEDEGLLRHVEDRRKGNCVERLVRTSARRYVIDPQILDGFGPGGAGEAARRISFSTDDLVVSACRTLDEVSDLLRPDPSVGERLPTLVLESHIRFRSPQEEVEFANALREFLSRMVERYHDPGAVGARTFRITVGGHLDPRAG